MSVDNPERDHTRPLASGKPPRDYSDSPLKRRNMVYDEPMDYDKEQLAYEKEQLDKERSALMKQAAKDVNFALEALNDVLSRLPAGRSRDTAAHYLSTTTLWIKQAFEEAQR